VADELISTHENMLSESETTSGWKAKPQVGEIEKW